MVILKTKAFIEEYLKIKDKSSNIIPFKLNAPQQKLYNAIKNQADNKKPVRIMVLKARQMGFSTFSEAIIFKNTAFKYNVKSGVVAHEEKSTNNLFEMSKLFYSNLPEPLKPKILASNAKELVFNDKERRGLNSIIKCMTAGNTRIGRSDTFQNLHISEYAFWGDNKETTLLGLLQSVPNKPGTMIIIESTANGFDDFKKRWDDAVAGKNDFLPVFCAWHELEEYRVACDFTDAELTPDERVLKAQFNLSNEQLAWRRWCIRNNCNGDIELFKQEYPSSPEEAFISSGKCIFDKELLIKRLNDLDGINGEKVSINYKAKYDEVGNVIISEIEYTPNKYGDLTLFEKPNPTHTYVLALDTAEGGEDYNAGQIIDTTTLQQVAVFHRQNIDAYKFAESMFCLGLLYNEAMISPEVNFNSFIVRHIEACGYKNIYQREEYDSIVNKVQFKYGFKTTAQTREPLLSELVKIVTENPTLLNDKATIREMLSFMRNKNGKAEAESSSHDDLVMALGIAYYTRHQQKIGATTSVNDRKDDHIPFALREDKQKQERWEDFYDEGY